MKRQVVLTVAESKRLIAKGVVALPEVKKAFAEGIVVVAEGTTNAYLLEELLGIKIDKRLYRSGITIPKEPEKLHEPPGERVVGVVFRKGKVAEDLDRKNAVNYMSREDVYIKGANALDYDRHRAGILIGEPTSGTIGAVMGQIVGKKIPLIIPVGLEKLVYDDINELHKLASEEDYEGPSLFPITGTIVSEIEALKTLTGVDATLYAAGGIAGAEGAVRLLIMGTNDEVENTLKLVESIRGEPRLLL